MSRRTLKARLNDRVVCARVDVSLTRRWSMQIRQQVATTGSHPPLRRTLAGCAELKYKKGTMQCKSYMACLCA